MNAKGNDFHNGRLDETLLTAYALEQLDGPERVLVEAALVHSPQAQRTVDEVRTLAGHVRQAARADRPYEPSATLRDAVEERLRNSDAVEVSPPRIRRPRRRWLFLAITAAAGLLLTVVSTVPLVKQNGPAPAGPVALDWSPEKAVPPSDEAAGREVFSKMADRPREIPVGIAAETAGEDLAGVQPKAAAPPADAMAVAPPPAKKAPETRIRKAMPAYKARPAKPAAPAAALSRAKELPLRKGDARAYRAGKAAAEPGNHVERQGLGSAGASPSQLSVTRTEKDGQVETLSAMKAGPAAPMPGKEIRRFAGKAPQRFGRDRVGRVAQQAAPPASGPVAGPAAGQVANSPVPALGTYGGIEMMPEAMPGGMPAEKSKASASSVPGLGGYGGGGFGGGAGGGLGGGADTMDSAIQLLHQPAAGVGLEAAQPAARALADGRRDATGRRLQRRARTPRLLLENEEAPARESHGGKIPGTEQYEALPENPFRSTAEEPESTFSIDVDSASYANARRFLRAGRLPPPAAVRVEEFVNYFRYDYPQPQGDVPFSVDLEAAQCPWKGDHRLVRIGLKGRDVHVAERGPSNLVFLLDVSGSMRDANKLPLVKDAMAMLVDQLTKDDSVAIVTYAGQAGIALKPTRGDRRAKIQERIEALSAGGSTHGSAGIKMAYEQARRNFQAEGNNRVILCTDGDLNVGITDDDELVELIREEAAERIFLTVLGFGTGNLKDAKLEKLADQGGGVYAYVDSLREARRLLVEQASGSLVTIAKDVKVQVEFNPAEVAAYRLIGYENRLMAAEDFDDDTKDAGEIGAGHTATALYEVVPQGGKTTSDGHGPGTALLTLKLRYKLPQENRSRLLEFHLKDAGKRFGQASDDFRFAASVAALAMLLRGSQYTGDLTLAAVEEFAAGATGSDPIGLRREFVDLVRQARVLRGESP